MSRLGKILILGTALLSFTSVHAQPCGTMGDVRGGWGGRYTVMDCWCKVCTEWTTTNVDLVEEWCSNATADTSCTD